MQITIELTQEEYRQLETHIQKAVMMSEIGFASLTIAERIAGKVYLAASEMMSTEEVHEQSAT